MAATDPSFNPQYLISYGPDTNCTVELCPVEASVLGYEPSMAATIVIIVLFAVTMVVHLLQGLKYRHTLGSFAIPVVIGCLDEIIGYAGRIILHSNPFSFAGFLMQIICITTAPVFFCAAIYVTLARTIILLDTSLARFNPKFLYYIFIPCDIISLVFQAAGGATSSTNSQNNIGVNLSLFGLAFQVFTLVIFIALSVDYLLRYHLAIRRYTRQHGTATSRHIALDGNDSGYGSLLRFHLFLAFLYLAILFILIRCIYRIDELSEGYSGSLFRNESIFYGLESAMIIAAVYCLNIGQPGFGLQASTNKM